MQLNSELVPIISKKQMDIEATKFLLKYYPEALENPIPLPVEEIAELKMGLEIDYVNIDENSSILGMMIFSEGVVELYDHDKGEYVPRIYDKGTLLVESNINDTGNRGRERFTIAHEIIHWHIHKPRFALMALRDKSLAKACRCPEEKVSIMRTPEDWMEWQADNLAAAILMPAEMFRKKAMEIKSKYRVGTPLKNNMWFGFSPDIIRDLIIYELAKTFQVSQQAAEIRVNTLEIQLEK